MAKITMLGTGLIGTFYTGIRIVSREFPDGANGAVANLAIIKTEKLPDGRTKTILKDKTTGRIFERIE